MAEFDTTGKPDHWSEWPDCLFCGTKMENHCKSWGDSLSVDFLACRSCKIIIPIEHFYGGGE